MFWADDLLKNIKGSQVVNDSFTPSGMVHMGSLKGPVIHDVLYKILKEKNIAAKFMYGFDDVDPIDGLSPDLQASHSQYLGVPLFLAPAPSGSGSFGEYFAEKMKSLLDSLGVDGEIYKTSELYKEGVFNKAIQHVLDNVDKVRKAYSEVYKKEISKDWFPMQVICPNCGKLGTTKVTVWDGKEVTFSCEENLVKWAKGCKTKGKISPFNGNGKMPWKVEWASKWWTFGVTIEGAGKDHASAGGSYDVAMKIVTDVFHAKQPLKLAYEFFLTGGKKMSSSKGVGLNGEELLEVLGPQRTRFLMIKSPPNQAVEFTPYGTDSIPKVFDDYQKASALEDQKRAFDLSQVGEKEKVSSVRFTTIAQWVQMPNMKSSIKGKELEEWARYARVWVEKYAPESEKFSVQKTLPNAAKNLSDKQKDFLQKVSSQLDKKWDAEDFQKNLYEWAKEIGLSSKDAFVAIYLSLIGKDHGPKAGWLILSLDKEFVKKRFEEVSKSSAVLNSNLEIPKRVRNDKLNNFFSINEEVRKKFPTISVGIAVIKGVKIEKSNPDLEKEKAEVLRSLDNLTTEQLGQYPEVISYRKLYKETGIDWHSRRPSPEALLRRVALKKGLYTVNTCVDAYNLIVMKHRVSIGAFDYDKIMFPTVLKFTTPEDTIHLLGEEQPTKFKTGEVAYFDKNGAFNMDFNYRDAQKTAVQLSTKNLYINVDGVYEITPQKVEQVLKEACDKITKYCGGKLELFGVETA